MARRTPQEKQRDDLLTVVNIARLCFERQFLLLDCRAELRSAMMRFGLDMQEWSGFAGHRTGVVDAIRRRCERNSKIGLPPEEVDPKIWVNLAEVAGIVVPSHLNADYRDRWHNRIVRPIYNSRGQNVAFEGFAVERLDDLLSDEARASLGASYSGRVDRLLSPTYPLFDARSYRQRGVA